MDSNLKLNAIGLRKCTLFRIVTNLDKDSSDHNAWAAAITRVEPMIKV